jgi:hypothetical protein
MTVADLADAYSTAPLAGRIVGALVFPVAGLVLLAIGVRQRSAARKQFKNPHSAGFGFIAIGVVVLVLGGIGIVGATLADRQKSSRRPAIGNCFTNAVVKDRPEWTPRRCTDAEAVLLYAANADANGNCPDGKQSNSVYLSLLHDGVRMCFAPNLLVGQCYASERADKSLRHANCTDKHTIRVVKRVDGSTDKSICPKHTRAVIYTQPARTYCTERTKKG